MPRLRQVPRAEASGKVQAYYERLFGERDPVAEPGTATGTPGHWWTVFALVPAIFEHATDHFAMVGDPERSRLDAKLRELALIRAGWARGSRFVFSQHCKAGRRAGVTDAQIAAIPAWSVSEAFSPAERAVLAWVDALVLADGRVSDGLFEALQAHLDDPEILELTYHTLLSNAHAIACRALRLEYDDVDERVTEVAMPGEGG